MKHAVMLSLLTIRSIPNGGQLVPRISRRVARWTMAFLDRRRETIDGP